MKVLPSLPPENHTNRTILLCDSCDILASPYLSGEFKTFSTPPAKTGFERAVFEGLTFQFHVASEFPRNSKKLPHFHHLTTGTIMLPAGIFPLPSPPPWGFSPSLRRGRLQQLFGGALNLHWDDLAHGTVDAQDFAPAHSAEGGVLPGPTCHSPGSAGGGVLLFSSFSVDLNHIDFAE